MPALASTFVLAISMEQKSIECFIINFKLAHAAMGGNTATLFHHLKK